MAVKTYAEQLEEVQTAISTIESGAQSYSVSGRALNRADLATLYARERYLRKMADREGNGGIKVRYGVRL